MSESSHATVPAAIQGRFLDGKSARPRAVSVALADRIVRITADDIQHDWSLDGVQVVLEGDQARLSHPADRDARLVLDRQDWIALAGDHGAGVSKRSRDREVRLVLGLTAFAAATTLFVFVGVPALSGPLARATPVSFEQGMGENFDLQVGGLFPTCDGQPGQDVLAALGDRIAEGADTPFDIRVRAVQAPMLNAFALPGGPVLITDDLIRDAKSPDELSAVIAHEVAHIEQRHVMQAVWRSLGIGLLLDAVVGGGTGAGQQAVLLAGQATDLRYGRAAESEADGRGQQLLHDQGMASTGMATFFARLGGKTEGETDDSPDAVAELERLAEFASTHPDSARRAREARAVERTGGSALSPAEWTAVREACGEDDVNPLEGLRRRFNLDRREDRDPA